MSNTLRFGPALLLCLLVCAPAFAEVREVFRTPTPLAIDTHWPDLQPQDITASPNQTPMLGRFGNRTVTLNLTDLPKHSHLRLTVRLYILRSWDGSTTRNGPDRFTIQIPDGPTLLNTTFAASKLPTTIADQQFPGLAEADRFPAATGASANNTMGYDIDSTYDLHYTFIHDKPTCAVQFTGSGLQALNDESWALGMVQVEALDESDIPALDDSELTKCLRALPDTDAKAACDAAWQLISQGDRIVPRLQQMLEDSRKLRADPNTVARVQRWIAELDDDDYQRREQAMKELAHSMLAALPHLKLSFQGKLSPEARWRVQQLLDQCRDLYLASPERMLTERIRFILQAIPTPASAALLNQPALFVDDPLTDGLHPEK